MKYLIYLNKYFHENIYFKLYDMGT